MSEIREGDRIEMIGCPKHPLADILYQCAGCDAQYRAAVDALVARFVVPYASEWLTGTRCIICDTVKPNFKGNAPQHADDCPVKAVEEAGK